MQMTVKSSRRWADAPNAFSCTARFVGVVRSRHIGHGDGLKWKFVIVGGDYHGVKVSRTTATQATMKNSAGEMLSSVAGRALRPGMAIDPDEFVGAIYHIMIEAAWDDTMWVGSARRAAEPWHLS